MGSFDNTIDNRWRPDFESSRRRVHEEEREEVVHFSRELSFVPARRKEFEPHNPPGADQADYRAAATALWRAGQRAPRGVVGDGSDEGA